MSTGIFSEIHTNPSFVDDEGRLRIFPYHDFTRSPLHCNANLCPPNLCKATVMEKIQACNKDKKFIYLGDGIGDFCPSLKLKGEDYLMPRKNFPVWELIRKNQTLIKAELHEWSDGQEMENVLLHLVKVVSVEKTSNGDSTQIVSAKLRTVPVTAH